MKLHELILFLDRSTDLRVGENLMGSSEALAPWIVVMLLSRKDKRSRVVTAVSFLRDASEMISLPSNTSDRREFEIGVEISAIWLAEADSEVNDGNWPVSLVICIPSDPTHQLNTRELTSSHDKSVSSTFNSDIPSNVSPSSTGPNRFPLYRSAHHPSPPSQ